MNCHNSQAGVSIIEILIVISVTAIISGFAIINISGAKDDFQRRNIARELKVSIERARFDSIKRSPFSFADQSKVVVNSATSFSLVSDFDQNGRLDAEDSRQIDFAWLKSIKIQENDLVYPITMSFDRRGFMTATNGIGTVVEPIFVVCDGCGASSDSFSVLTISPTGTVRMTEGSQSLPSFPLPEVTEISSGSQINLLAMIE